MSNRYPDACIIPLAPVIREDCPGTVSRQLIELATWYKSVYNNNILGLTSVWDTLISVLSKTDEDGLDLGYSEHYTVAMPAYLAPSAPLRNFKFKTDSSHTTTIGMDCVASNELLYPLINTLKCTFPTTANTEEIFSDEPAEFESIPSKKTVHMFGGSNMRKIVPKLEKHNFVVIDHTVPGWVPTPGNIAKLAEKIETADPSDYIIADLLGNVTHRYTQADGTLAMPYKVDFLLGTPTKRQVSKRQVSKRLVSKRLVSKRQVYKTSGLQNVRFQNVWFQNVQFLNLLYLFNKKYRNWHVSIPF
jgi:hypothetical protein